MIADIVEKLLAARQLTIENRETVERALRTFRRGRADFADYVIAHSAHASGCERVLTFDSALLTEDPDRYRSP